MELEDVELKQTDMGMIPSDWEIKSIGEVAHVVGGGTPSTQIEEFWKGEINWFTPTEIGDKKYSSKSLRTISEDGLNNSSAKLLPAGTVLMTSRASIGDLSILTEPAATNQGFQSLIAKDSISYEFLYYAMHMRQGPLLRSASGSTFLEISPAKVRAITIHLPPTLHEQRAIATALSDVDALIAGLDKLIEKKKAIKQGVMQELLTSPDQGGKRLDGFSAKWRKVKLSEVADLFKGKGLPKAGITDDGKYRCVHYGELFSHYGQIIKGIRSRTDMYENMQLSMSNDFLMPTSDVTPTGLATGCAIKEEGIVLGGDILIIRCKIDHLDNGFLSYCVSLNRSQIMSFVRGITVYHLYASDMKNFSLYLPEIKEQQVIADLLEDIETEIQSHEAKRIKYTNIRRGMMQELLTGKTRLV